MNKKLLLIDGHSILNRAYYGVPELTNSEGIHTNAVYGFVNMMLRAIEDEKADHIVVAFDLKEPTFRHKMFDEYKGTRKPMPDDLHEQVPIMKELLKAMNISIATLPGYEADDVLGTLSVMGEKQGYDVTVLSGDRDLLQLATKIVKIRIPKTKGGYTEVENYYDEDVIAKYQVNPQEFIDLKALMGDTSDNIPGVPGVGEKTATKLIVDYSSVENIYEHIDDVEPARIAGKLRDNKELAELSLKLARIDVNAPVEMKLEESFIEDFYTPEAYDIIKRLEFKNILSRFDSHKVSKQEVSSEIIDVTDKDMLKKVENMAVNSQVVGISFSFEETKKEESQLSFDFLNDSSDSKKSNDNFGIRAICITFEAGNTYYATTKNNITSDDLYRISLQIFESDAIVSIFELKDTLYHFASDEEKIREHLVFDIAIAAYLLNPLKDMYHYDDIQRDYLSNIVPSVEELFAKRTADEVYNNDEETFKKFLSLRALTAFTAYETMVLKLKENGMYKLYQEVELPLIYALFEMEQVGIGVNRTALKEYGNKLAVSIDKIEKEIYEEVGEEFNINSPKQLGVILFEKMEIPGSKKTKTGYSTSADVLEKLAPEYPVISKILEYRQLTKLKSTYADGLSVYIGEDNRIHGRFNQTITATGRISSTEPNLQNIPIRMELGREIRKVFVPKEGCVFVDADYSQIELRVLAHISGDKNLIEAYNEAQDIHQITASKVFHTPLNEVTKTQRSNAKAVNFGIVYGISSFGLSQDLSISRKEASGYIEEYFKTYPDIKNFLDNTVEQAKKDGFVTTMFGRIRPIPELKSSNFMQRSFGERVAMNSPIQGTAADIIKIAMVNVNNAMKVAKLKSRIVLQVHDELLVETYKDELDIVKKILEDNMQNAAELKVPLEIGMEVGENWFEAH